MSCWYLVRRRNAKHPSPPGICGLGAIPILRPVGMQRDAARRRDARVLAAVDRVFHSPGIRASTQSRGSMRCCAPICSVAIRRHRKAFSQASCRGLVQSRTRRSGVGNQQPARIECLTGEPLHGADGFAPPRLHCRYARRPAPGAPRVLTCDGPREARTDVPRDRAARVPERDAISYFDFGPAETKCAISDGIVPVQSTGFATVTDLPYEFDEPSEPGRLPRTACHVVAERLGWKYGRVRSI